MRRPSLFPRLVSCCAASTLLLSLPLLPLACGSDGGDTAPAEDTGAPPDDTVIVDTYVKDVPPTIERVLILRLWDPKQRCLYEATQIGNREVYPDGGFAPCDKGEVCYVRKDGVVAYHTEDCIKPGKYLAPWDKQPYSDLGPCEPAKNALYKLSDCPTPSCTLARDVTIDTARSCATTVRSVGCRGKEFDKPTACWCSAGSPDLAYVAADPAATTGPGGDFAKCDATNAACKKALAVVDTVTACAGTTVDAGPDASFDGSVSD